MAYEGKCSEARKELLRTKAIDTMTLGEVEESGRMEELKKYLRT